MVQPDPVKEPLAVAQPTTIPITAFQANAIFPTTSSPFVVVSQKGMPTEVREIYDLRNGRKVGTITPASGHSEFALSPDGNQLAARILAPKTTVEVFSVADGRSVRKFEVDDKAAWLQGIDFAGPGQLLTAKGMGLEVLFQVWDVAGGNPLRQFQTTANADAKLRALSGDRRYLALPRGDNKVIQVYDLTTAELAGEAVVPPLEFGFLTCSALAFSPDGKKLAGFFASGFDGRLISWDVTSGKLAADVKMEKDPQWLAQNAHGYQGRRLEWFPDGTALLAYGQLVIDPTTAKVVWTVPAEGFDGSARRVVGPGLLASVKGGFNDKKLVLETLPRDKIETAVQAVRAGKDPAATKLPPVKAADLTAVRNLGAPVGAAAWTAQPDPAPVPKGKLGGQRIPLQGKGNDVQRILFSSPDVGQAVVLTAVGEDNSLRKQVRADRYDLAGGRHMGGLDLFVVEMPKERPLMLAADASPDGGRLVVLEPRDERRVDVWSAADQQHVAGWEPFEKESDPKVRWVAMLDTTHALTLGVNGKLVLWTVPECKAVYAVSCLRGAVAVSPGRKTLAAFNGATYEILDSFTGERKGQLGGAVQAVLAAGFRGDGQELAAVVQTDQPCQLLRWDLKSGKPLAPLPCAVGSDVAWFGPTGVVIGMTLIDTQTGWSLSQLATGGPGRFATSSPDGRLWFAYSQNAKDPAVLTAQTVPDTATRELAAQIAAGAVKPALGPGMSVTLQLDIQAPSKADEYRKQITDNLTVRLRSAGLTVAAGDAEVRLQIQLGPERNTGKVMELESIGARGKRFYKVPIKEVPCRASLTDKGGAVLWQLQHTLRTPDSVGIIRTDDPLAHFSELLWNNCASWGLVGGLPMMLVRTPKGLEPLPKVVFLRGDP
jgi:WD40 repeat protein